MEKLVCPEIGDRLNKQLPQGIPISGQGRELAQRLGKLNLSPISPKTSFFVTKQATVTLGKGLRVMKEKWSENSKRTMPGFRIWTQTSHSSRESWRSGRGLRLPRRRYCGSQRFPRLEQAPTLQSSFLWTIYEAVAKEDILEADTSMSCQDFTERLFHDEEGHPIALTEIQALRDLASVQTGRDELSPDWIWTIFERLANPELV